MKQTGYAGTYTSGKSEGIYRFEIEDGILSNPGLFCKIKNPKYLAEYSEGILAVNDFEDGSGVTLIGWDGKILDQCQYEPKTAAYVAVDGNTVYTANYHTGGVGKLTVEGTHLKLEKLRIIQDGGGCHQILFYKDYILVPCLLMDQLQILNKDLETVHVLNFEQGTGPRHGVFAPDGYLYLASELGNELYRIDPETWTILEKTLILPDGRNHEKGTAAIRLSEDGTLVYISTRGADLISVVDIKGSKMKLVQTASCLGSHPRDFILQGNHLISANRFSDEAVSIQLHDGLLAEPDSRITIPEVISLLVK
ncbi:MAG: lactonase family protein [Solobacterium sp.]|jgi:6-phosphogluconolactonase (cycloisomerase 2 family)|nr:lactonase family protein [Solobacterium sp.]MCH4223078.1 lactonase family protein [Solobacterium sp.]MCH4265999.1 lactonase family protein [Solobacterium sp.]